MSAYPSGRPPSGEHERRLAVGSVAQQGAQVLIYTSSLALVTVLGRRLQLPAFGTYSLFVAFATYLLFAQASVEGAAVKLLAEARDREGRDSVFTTSVVLYAAAGLFAAFVVAACGVGLPGPLGVPEALQADARLGAALAALATLVGWPLRACRDSLRAMQLFRRVALADAVGYVTMAALSIAVAFADGPLYLLIALGGSIPLFIGVAAAVIFAGARLPLGWRPSSLRRSTIRTFLVLSWHLLQMGASDFVIYSLDRVLLAAFRSPTVVGLYEPPLRAHNLVRLTAGTFSLPVLPAASQYLAEGDDARVRELMLRGTRYVLVVVTPLVAVICLLSAPLLDAWLGPRFREAAPAMSIFVAYWAVNANVVVPGPMLIAAGESRWMARYGWAVAAVTLGLSLVLTPPLGLEGLVLGTTVGILLCFPFFYRISLRRLSVRFGEIVRRAWFPAYSTLLLPVVLLAVLRLGPGVEGLAQVMAAGVAALALYWGAFWVAWMDPGERRLIGATARGLFRTGA